MNSMLLQGLLHFLTRKHAKFRSAIFKFRTYLVVMGRYMYEEIQCIPYSKAEILFYIKKYPAERKVFFGERCTCCHS